MKKLFSLMLIILLFNISCKKSDKVSGNSIERVNKTKPINNKFVDKYGKEVDIIFETENCIYYCIEKSVTGNCLTIVSECDKNFSSSVEML